MKQLYSLFCLVLIFTGCKTSVDRQQFLSWSRDPKNGLRAVKTIQGLNFDVQYKPAVYLSCESKEPAPSHFTDSVKQISLNIAHIDGTDLIQSGASSVADVQRSLYYFSFLFQNDISLDINGNRIPCSLFHFEKAADSKNGRTFHLIFDVGEPSAHDEFALVIDSERLSALPIYIKLGNPHLPQVSGL